MANDVEKRFDDFFPGSPKGRFVAILRASGILSGNLAGKCADDCPGGKHDLQRGHRTSFHRGCRFDPHSPSEPWDEGRIDAVDCRRYSAITNQIG
ncbi:hypothetical protein IB265_29625 [Ensifer sp. ENS10]|uniref:hypothetical protein n=1 Tax=Ensifer sp. ENS10 TaxID=2769286 RepID=UPI0017846760|nr:hypothetical protein [Ensifer sp. ENS10]MBD9510934.1 hypothetical protein [Ensifer sp. ENS10]